MPDYIRNFVPLQETFQLESIGQNPKSLQHPRYVSLLYFRGGWLHGIQHSLVLIRMGAIIPITHWRCPLCWHILYGHINSGLIFSPRFYEYPEPVYILTFIPVLAYRELTDCKQGTAQVQTEQARIVCSSLNLHVVTNGSIHNKLYDQVLYQVWQECQHYISKQVAFQYAHEFLTRNEQQECYWKYCGISLNLAAKQW